MEYPLTVTPLRASDLWSEGNQNIADLTMVYNYAADRSIVSVIKFPS